MVYEDLADHHSQWVNPISIQYHDVHLHEIPPNGQGLAALIALGILRKFDLRQYPVDSADSIHLQVEAMKIALAEAYRHIADSSAMTVEPADTSDRGISESPGTGNPYRSGLPYRFRISWSTRGPSTSRLLMRVA